MQTQRVRYAIIGIGAGVFNMHRKALQLPEINLVAGSDIQVEVGERRAHELQCAFYADYQQLLREVQPDVAVIIVPHTFHKAIALDCLRSGAHVLVEKPMALQVQDADTMIDVAASSGRKLGVVFQHRFRPEIRAARKILQDGTLGTLQHISLQAVWPRTASYFAQAGWRGTWKGEGGGVLMNQAAHNLDLLCHLAGMPARVSAWTRRLVHQIQAEDTVQAMLEWPGGALGSVHISTAETGLSEQIEIVGTGGHLTITPGKLALHLLAVDFKEHAHTHPDPFAVPSEHETPVTLDQEPGDHVAVYRAFNQAILQGSEYYNTDGQQGRMSLELANAMILSNYSQGIVEFPLDRQRYADLLHHLQA